MGKVIIIRGRVFKTEKNKGTRDVTKGTSRTNRLQAEQVTLWG